MLRDQGNVVATSELCFHRHLGTALPNLAVPVLAKPSSRAGGATSDGEPSRAKRRVYVNAGRLS